MSSKYEDWADWAGDHTHSYNLAGASCDGCGEPRACNYGEQCEHAEVSPSGYCENCGDIVAGWEPDDAQLLMQSGTKEPAV